MAKDDMIYHLGLGFEVKIAKWRIDDQSIPENNEWCLWVYDRNKEQWVQTSQLDRPGESAVLKIVHVFDE